MVGTRAALAPITKFGAFFTYGGTTEMVNDNVKEIMSTGWLGKYYGAPIEMRL